jgi:hypothetical protein
MRKEHLKYGYLFSFDIVPQHPPILYLYKLIIRSLLSLRVLYTRIMEPNSESKIKEPRAFAPGAKRLRVGDSAPLRKRSEAEESKIKDLRVGDSAPLRKRSEAEETKFQDPLRDSDNRMTIVLIHRGIARKDTKEIIDRIPESVLDLISVFELDDDLRSRLRCNAKGVKVKRYPCILVTLNGETSVYYVDQVEQVISFLTGAL